MAEGTMRPVDLSGIPGLDLAHKADLRGIPGLAAGGTEGWDISGDVYSAGGTRYEGDCATVDVVGGIMDTAAAAVEHQVGPETTAYAELADIHANAMVAGGLARAIVSQAQRPASAV